MLVSVAIFSANNVFAQAAVDENLAVYEKTSVFQATCPVWVQIRWPT